MCGVSSFLGNILYFVYGTAGMPPGTALGHRISIQFGGGDSGGG